MSRCFAWTSCLAVALVAALSAAADAEEWGTLKGRFVYDAAVPDPVKITPTKDVEFCGKQGLVDQSLVIAPNGGVKNIVVYLRNRSTDKVAIHPDYKKELKPLVKLDNKGCRFEPHLVTVWVSEQKLLLSNSDPVGHNTNIQPILNQGTNVLLPSGGETEFELQVPESLPIGVSCNIHPWMKGWILARDTPYMAVTDKDGNFEIKNLPAGEWLFQTWHEKSGYLNTPDWGRTGRFTMEIKPGENDLGTIKLGKEIFEK